MATLVDIEKFMYNWYKSKVQLEKSQFELNKVELKKSKIHGYGVFATKNISKDELITFYPGDIVLYIPNKDRHLPNHHTLWYRSKRFEN
jgi:SET domain-containing protein